MLSVHAGTASMLSTFPQMRHLLQLMSLNWIHHRIYRISEDSFLVSYILSLDTCKMTCNLTLLYHKKPHLFIFTSPVTLELHSSLWLIVPPLYAQTRFCSHS